MIQREAPVVLRSGWSRFGKYITVGLLGWFTVCPCVPFKAQTSKPTVVSTESPDAQRPTDSKVPLLQQPLRLVDFVGSSEKMGPSSALASQLTHLEGFTQNTPEDGKAATERTEVWLGRTAARIASASLVIGIVMLSLPFAGS